MRKYCPRRASVKRWLAEAPDYVLDIFDDKRTTDRYTVFFGVPLCYSISKEGVPLLGPDEFSNTYIQYLSMSDAPSHPQGISLWGEMKAYEAANYRYHNKHRRIKWVDLPWHIRLHVQARAEEP